MIARIYLALALAPTYAENKDHSCLHACAAEWYDSGPLHLAGINLSSLPPRTYPPAADCADTICHFTITASQQLAASETSANGHPQPLTHFRSNPLYAHDTSAPMTWAAAPGLSCDGGASHGQQAGTARALGEGLEDPMGSPGFRGPLGMSSHHEEQETGAKGEGERAAESLRGRPSVGQAAGLDNWGAPSSSAAQLGDVRVPPKLAGSKEMSKIGSRELEETSSFTSHPAELERVLSPEVLAARAKRVLAHHPDMNMIGYQQEGVRGWGLEHGHGDHHHHHHQQQQQHYLQQQWEDPGVDGCITAAVNQQQVDLASLEQLEEMTAAYAATMQYNRMADMQARIEQHKALQQQQQQEQQEQPQEEQVIGTSSPSEEYKVQPSDLSRVSLKGAAYALTRLQPANESWMQADDSQQLSTFAGTQAPQQQQQPWQHYATDLQHGLSADGVVSDHSAGKGTASSKGNLLSSVKSAFTIAASNSFKNLNRFAIRRPRAADGGAPGQIPEQEEPGMATEDVGGSSQASLLMRRNRSLAFQEELLTVQRTARSRIVDDSGQSWAGTQQQQQQQQQGVHLRNASPQQSAVAADPRRSCHKSSIGMEDKARTGVRSSGAVDGRGRVEPVVAVEFDIQYLRRCRAGKAGTTQGKTSSLVLGHMSGSFQPYTMTCLLGPSGCGKSTLLDVLRGHRLLQKKDTHKTLQDLNQVGHCRGNCTMTKGSGTHSNTLPCTSL